MNSVGVSLNIVKPITLNITGVSSRPVPNSKPVQLSLDNNGDNSNNSNSSELSESMSPSAEVTNNSSDRVTADIYQRYDSTREHIYNITDTYAGSDEKMARDERVLDLENNMFKIEEITLPEAVERIFIEISSNAGDNVARSLRAGVDPGEVTILMDRYTISVRNGGIPIPIEIHSQYGIWAPQLIFGILHSSSNYDKNKVRTECGRNGYGAKLTNIFSKQFMVTVGDPHNSKWYRQIWQENMTIVSEPEIKDYTGPAFVEVVYKMDFERFGYTQYPDEAFGLYARHAADMSFTGKVPVSFNGTKFHVQDALDYAKLYLGEEATSNSFIYYMWPKGTETYFKKGVEYSKTKGVVPEVEVCVVDTPDTAISVSFANGMWTRQGGVHADAAFKAVASGIVDTINSGKLVKEKKGRKFKLNLGDVKKHVSMFLTCWVPNPKFDSQSKKVLRTPAPKINIDKKLLEPIMKWNLVHRLYAELEAKHYKVLSKSDGKKKRYLSEVNGKDANFAGTAKSHMCTLYIVEGGSAGGFAEEMMCLFEKGRDVMGIFPLRGKPLNVMNAPAQQIAENNEILELKKMVGLRENVDYLDPENMATLRYGKIMVMPDSDVDGKHILGLVINLFHCRYPSLLARGYVNYLRTKIIDVRKGNRYFKFYTNNEYEEWRDQNPDYKTWTHNYYKGLGTSETSDIEEEFRSPRIVSCIYDDLAPVCISKAFDKDMADQRKEWIKEWHPDFSVEEMDMQPISAFINHELIQFSVADLGRSLPRFMDGLKTTQRKIIWGCMKKWKAKVGSEKATKIKVVNLGAYVSDITSYHHGDKSINDTIIKMAQDHVGANNMNYLCPHGQFGTRDEKGKNAAAPRYIFTKPTWWWSYIYKKEDMSILEMVIDEGIETEPVTFLPIIPMQLVNGCHGIGTGHSTFIPNHNPLDICNWLINKINGKPLEPVVPWYKGFAGTIEVKVRAKKKKDKKGSDKSVESSMDTTQQSETSVDNLSGDYNTNDDLDDDNAELEEDDVVFIDNNTKYTMITKGVFEEVGNKRKKIVITELPIGRGTNEYEKWLLRMRADKMLSNVAVQSVKNGVYMEITGLKNPTYRKLRLQRSFGLSNMVLLDNNNRPIKYSSTLEILESFYVLRLPYYEMRRQNIIAEIGERIQYLNNKIRFIRSVIAGHELVQINPQISISEAVNNNCILVMNRKKSDIVPQMEALHFSSDLLKKVTLYNCTYEEVQAAQEELEKLETEKADKEAITSKELWLHDIEEFIQAYCKKNKVKNERKVKKVSLNLL